jgi:hypothetical protein
MCSSLSAVMMCLSSGERTNAVRKDVCPRTSAPPDGFWWDARVSASASACCAGTGAGVGSGVRG